MSSSALIRHWSLQVSTGVGSVGQVFNVSVPNPHLWSPSDPFLYNVTVSLTPTAQPAVFSQAVIVYAAGSTVSVLICYYTM